MSLLLVIILYCYKILSQNILGQVLLDLNQKILFKTYYIHCNVLGAIANSSDRNKKQVVYVESII